jgi:hypothetical protein
MKSLAEVKIFFCFAMHHNAYNIYIFIVKKTFCEYLKLKTDLSFFLHEDQILSATFSLKSYSASHVSTMSLLFFLYKPNISKTKLNNTQ